MRGTIAQGSFSRVFSSLRRRRGRESYAALESGRAGSFVVLIEAPRQEPRFELALQGVVAEPDIEELSIMPLSIDPLGRRARGDGVSVSVLLTRHPFRDGVV